MFIVLKIFEFYGFFNIEGFEYTKLSAVTTNSFGGIVLLKTFKSNFCV